jgi:3-hydroxyacyl-CoA dehydrogenase/3a,7a,12a-trihydroxy-5b-cholest-24-enoyl-CoA hydratase
MVSSLKSEAIFDLITRYLASGEGADTVKKISAIYQFDILEKKGGKVVKTWTIDMKNDKGHCKEGKPESYDSLFTLVDNDFVAIVEGKLNAQMAVVQGKMKIKGNMKKATAFTPDLFPKPTPENMQKYSKAKF